MNKKEFVHYILDSFNIDDLDQHKKQKKIISASVDVFFTSVRDALLKGDRVEIRGLGAFSVKTYDSYTGRNPRTGEAVQVEGKMMPTFKPGKVFKEIVNSED